MKITKYNGFPYWIDNNNNVWSARLYSESEAYKLSLTLENCSYCINCTKLTNCVRCNECSSCNNIQDSIYCFNCNNSSFLFNCRNCFACYGLANTMDGENIKGGNYA